MHAHPDISFRETIRFLEQPLATRHLLCFGAWKAAHKGLRLLTSNNPNQYDVKQSKYSIKLLTRLGSKLFANCSTLGLGTTTVSRNVQSVYSFTIYGFFLYVLYGTSRVGCDFIPVPRWGSKLAYITFRISFRYESVRNQFFRIAVPDQNICFRNEISPNVSQVSRKGGTSSFRYTVWLDISWLTALVQERVWLFSRVSKNDSMLQAMTRKVQLEQEPRNDNFVSFPGIDNINMRWQLNLICEFSILRTFSSRLFTIK